MEDEGGDEVGCEAHWDEQYMYIHWWSSTMSRSSEAVFRNMILLSKCSQYSHSEGSMSVVRAATLLYCTVSIHNHSIYALLYSSIGFKIIKEGMSFHIVHDLLFNKKPNSRLIK